jgi:RNA polymerase sigma-70 factor (TIGR02957 family)
MSLRTEELEVFEASRNRLGAIAYRMLGSAAEAEDVVQETFLRWQSADRSQIRVPEAWLTKVATNLCLNELASARTRRESYVGQWLPEPVLDGDPLLGPAETAEQRESVSLAVLLLLERLSPAERAVYVLREAFGHRHAEIADILDITESNSQQLYRRAREHVSRDRTRSEVDAEAARKVVEEFIAAASNGQLDRLIDLLSDEAIGVGDGGGKVAAAPHPFLGAERVAVFIRGLFKPTEAKRRLIGGSPDVYLARANGAPALIVTIGDAVVGVMEFDVVGERVTAIRNQANPDKLERATRMWRERDHGEPLIRGW